jgi:hypothetical protein
MKSSAPGVSILQDLSYPLAPQHPATLRNTPRHAVIPQIPLLLEARGLKEEVLRIAAWCKTEGRALAAPPDCPADLLAEGEVVGQLYRWLATIAGVYGLGLAHFSPAFSDGSLLCCLVRAGSS